MFDQKFKRNYLSLSLLIFAAIFCASTYARTPSISNFDVCSEAYLDASGKCSGDEYKLKYGIDTVFGSLDLFNPKAEDPIVLEIIHKETQDLIARKTMTLDYKQASEERTNLTVFLKSQNQQVLPIGAYQFTLSLPMHNRELKRSFYIMKPKGGGSVITNSGVSTNNVSNNSSASKYTTPAKISSQGVPLNYYNQRVENVDFSNQDLRNADFSRSRINNVNFSGANLTGATFQNAEIKNSNFSGANIQNSCFVDAKVNSSSMMNVDFRGAVLMNAQFESVNLDGVDQSTLMWDASNCIAAKRRPPLGQTKTATSQAVVATREMKDASTIAAELNNNVGKGSKGVDLTINFKTGSAELFGNAHKQVSEIAKALNLSQLSGRKILIEGHTDNQGEADYNLDLSYRRAATVQKVLSNDYNVDISTISIEGFGETQPIASNMTDGSRALNRRVTLKNLP